MAVFVITKEIADALITVTTKYHNGVLEAETFLQGEWIKYMEQEKQEEQEQNEQKISKRAARVENRTDRRR